MLESINFTYAGISCEDMGVALSIDGGGLIKESLPKRKVNYTRIPYREKSIFQRVDTEPLSFVLPLYLHEWSDRNNMRAIMRWLNQETFQPLIFESNTDQIFYAILDGEPTLTHNGLQQGILTVQFICNSPYAYSELKMDSFVVNGYHEALYFNEGDISFRPQLKIRKIGDGDISITNTENGQVMLLNNIYNNEVITINGENEEITSSLESSNRFILEHHNDVWLDFKPNFFNDTKFIFEGNFECEFYYEYKYRYQDRPIYFE